MRDTVSYNGITVDGGAIGTIVTTNEVSAARSVPIAVQGATNTAVTSNTVGGCGPEISVTGSSTGTSIENNVLTVPGGNNCPTAGALYGVQVDASSVGSSTLDYNDVYAGTAGDPYSWNGAAYATAAALYSGAKQGRHDYNGSDGVLVAENSPIINSANSAAIGAQSTDVYGNSRSLDPLVTPTGAGPYNDYDRGASQFQDPYAATTNSSVTASATKVPLGTTISANATGYYPAYALVEAAGSSSYHYLSGINGPVILVVAPQPLTPKETLIANGELGVLAGDGGTTDAWNISSATFDFGDGTPTETVADGAQASHTYAKAGTYTITEKVVDTDGNTATTTSTFTTTDPPAGTLVGVQVTGGIPTGTTGFVQSAVSGANSTDLEEILAATTSGQAEFNTAGVNSGWQGWRVLSQQGVTVKWVGIAGMPNGSSQLIEVTSTGTLLHTVLNADGTW